MPGAGALAGPRSLQALVFAIEWALAFARAAQPARLLLALTAFAGIATFLLVLGPMVLPYRVETVLSGSMEPTLPVGSLAVLRPTPAQRVTAGDIIAFRPPAGRGELVTHRVVIVMEGASGRYFTTQGDANPVSDPWLIPGTGEGWRYVFDVPYLGYGISTLRSRLGRLLLLTLPVLALGFAVVAPLWLPPKLPRAAAQN